MATVSFDVRVSPSGAIETIEIDVPSVTTQLAASALSYAATAAATSFPGAGDWQNVNASAWGSRSNSSRLVPQSDGGIKNTSAEAIEVDASLSVSTTSGNNKLLEIGFAVDATHLVEYDVQRFVATGADVGAVATHTDGIMLQPGETLYAQIRNVTDATDATAEKCVFSVIERTDKVTVA